MLTINAADEFGRPNRWTWTSTNAVAANPLTSTVSPMTSANGTGAVPWLRADRTPTVPFTGSVAAGGNTNITFIFPGEHKP